MIVHFSVCEHCGRQKQISEEVEETGFEFFYYTTDLRDALKNTKSYFQNKFKSGTFCDRSCLIEFIKNNIDDKGKQK
jgi:hypothetical protein